MKHPLKNRLLGFAFMASIALSYVVFVPPIQAYLWLRGRKRDLAWLGYYYFEFLLRLFRIQPTVEGLENIPKDRSFILLSNHQSFVDIGCLINRICPLAFLAKKELFSTPFFGSSLQFMGCIPIDRGNREANAALPNLLRTRIRDERYNYCVYPEGTRSRDGRLLPFKNGIFKIIQESPVLTIPVTLIGTGKAMPSSGLSLYPGKHPHMVIHKPIEPEEIAAMQNHEFRDRVRATIASALPNP